MDAERSQAEGELLRELKSGDTGALERLMDYYGEDLMKYLCAILGSKETAEDAFQDTWMLVMENIGDFETEREFAPWLFRIARNRAYDMLRRRKGRWLSLPDESRQPKANTLRSEPAFESECLDRETAQQLLAKLDPSHREILWRRFFRDESYEELSKNLRIPVGTVKSRLKRALDRLAHLYEFSGGGAREHQEV